MATDQQKLLPETGPGSAASWPRRIVALLIDWALANIVAVLLFGGDVLDTTSTAGERLLPLLCWFVLVTLTTAFTGASTGQWLLGIRVARLDRQRVGLPRAAARTALIALIVPPLINNDDRRGLHDLAAQTAVVNHR